MSNSHEIPAKIFLALRGGACYIIFRLAELWKVCGIPRGYMHLQGQAERLENFLHRHS